MRIEQHQQRLDAKATYAQQIRFLYRKQKPSELEEYEQLRNIISSNLQQLVCFYQQIKDERQRLYEAEYELEGNVFSAFFEIEMFFELVEGYANAISQYGSVKQSDSAIKELEHGNIFNNNVFTEWLSAHASEYPNILTYVALVNNFRIQIIEYLKQK
ncbi:hypothetical protein PN36_10440 [Candidatus Thiomargarita nelsonii]|uniref:Uncharacterized protein n=1 Tax=Candidatus Thiomargarita nelsonii TaxID=1003181 RepID=A0A0A6PEC8_9GAMM|nr:hypothetical protein PN36_10440 [Candidatus Thiomargarita nelsonii]